MLRVCSLLGVLALVACAPVFGDAIAADGSYHEFLFGGAVSAVTSCGGGGCTPTTSPVAEQTTAPPWTFSGAATLFVIDLFQHGDRFEAFDGGSSIGSTSVVVNDGLSTCDQDIACAIGDVAYSRATIALGAGAHSLTFNIIQNAANTTGGAAVFSVSQEVGRVPEPATYGLIGLGLGLLGLVRARRRA
jgi:hypothetical protein